MTKLHPEKPNEVIRKLRALGYEGPYPGGKHVFMRYPLKKHKISVPYHKGRDIPKGTIREIIRVLGITVENGIIFKVLFLQDFLFQKFQCGNVWRN